MVLVQPELELAAVWPSTAPKRERESNFGFADTYGANSMSLRS
jgi:hypothetical protein